MEDIMKPVSPRAVLDEIAGSIPGKCKKNIIIIGSLAVGYHFFAGEKSMVVRTKDADCLLSPRLKAVSAGKIVTEQLFDAGWNFKTDENWPKPGGKTTPLDKLPAVRLNPPCSSDWFIELLTVPDSAESRSKIWIRLETSHGHFGICSFGFLSLTNFKPLPTEFGICIARPEMMALANMLEHKKIGEETMSGLIQGRSIKRSNKDLGRVLAIAYLSNAQNEDAILDWPKIWIEALKMRFPDDWPGLAHTAGAGLRILLDSSADMDEAYHSCIYGLLASKPPARAQLIIAGKRLLADAVIPLEKAKGK